MLAFQLAIDESASLLLECTILGGLALTELLNAVSGTGLPDIDTEVGMKQLFLTDQV